VQARVRVDLLRVVLRLQLADRCARTPVAGDGEVLRPADTGAAGCRRVRPYRGSLELTRIDRAGVRRPIALNLPVEDGAATLELAALERAIRRENATAWADTVRVELGAAGWAGTLRVDRLDQVRSEWHLAWVRAGRGSAALVAAAPGVSEDDAALARALAVEAALARQERDYLAVSRGELDPLEFLRRYAWSPFLASVRSMARAVASDAGRGADERGSVPDDDQGAAGAGAAGAGAAGADGAGTAVPPSRGIGTIIGPAPGPTGPPGAAPGGNIRCIAACRDAAVTGGTTGGATPM
jgi:hypothetical protein